MNKKDIFAPVLIIALSGIFIFVALAVFFTKGKSAFWVSKKIKIGALLLSLTAMTQNQACQTTCYDISVDETDIIVIDTMYFKDDILKVDINNDNKIIGTIYEREKDFFSFNLTDTLRENILQEGEIKALDGIYDNLVEDFFIELDTSLKSNIYYLHLFVESDIYASFMIELKNEKQ